MFFLWWWAPTWDFFVTLCVFLYIYMVSFHQDQNPIMKFAVPLLKMFALCMLWRAQFLYDFYSVFAFIRSWSLYHFKLKFGNRRCPKKSEYFFLLLDIIHDEKNLRFYFLNYTRLQKVEYLVDRNSDPYEILYFSS